MFENYYFLLGVINNVFLIIIFLLVKVSETTKVKRVGLAYLFLAIPTIYGIWLAQQLQKPIAYSLFLLVFLAFLLLEGVYEFVLKVSFRKSIKLLIPYLMFYWSMNYGFIVMAWKNSRMQGSIVLGLFIIQLIANLATHIKKKE